MISPRSIATGTLALLLLFGVTVPAWAGQVPTRFGFFGGANAAGMASGMDLLGELLAIEEADLWSGDWTSDAGRLTRPVLGAYFAFAPLPHISLQVEAQYAQRGARIELAGRNLSPDYSEVSSRNNTYDFKFAYVEIAAIGRIEPWRWSSVSPFLMAGPALGIKADADVEYNGSRSGSVSQLATSEVFHLVGGAGFAVAVAEGSRFVAQARYVYGLTDLFNDGSDTAARDLTLAAGFEIRLRGSGNNGKTDEGSGVNPF